MLFQRWPSDNSVGLCLWVQRSLSTETSSRVRVYSQLLSSTEPVNHKTEFSFYAALSSAHGASRSLYAYIFSSQSVYTASTFGSLFSPLKTPAGNQPCEGIKKKKIDSCWLANAFGSLILDRLRSETSGRLAPSF